MRVLQLIPTLVVGGAERVVARLARHLHRWGYTVEVVSMYDPYDTWIEAELRSEEVPLTFLGKRRGFDVRMIPRIARVVARFKPDVLHTHLYVLKYALPGLAASRRCRVVHTLHNVASREVEWPNRMLQRLLFRAGVIPVAIGQGVAESMRDVYGLYPRHIIPNGIPVSDYAPPPAAREELRAALSIPEAAPTFVMVAMFERQKNHEGLLRALASSRLAAAGAHLLLAGDGERRREMERLAHALGIADRVRFLGICSDVPRVLAAADAFVLPSEYEGNPMAVLEAMAAGKPVVATGVGCIPELVSDRTGRVIPPADPVALETALHELASDLPAAREKGAAAARVARERFDDVTMARAYERLYLEATSRPGSA